MERKIKGYRLKEECKQYKEAAEKITGYDNSSIEFKEFMEKVGYSPSSYCATMLQKAGVLDLWFDPVYEEEYKVGDWVVIITPSRYSGNIENMIGKITDIRIGYLTDYGGCLIHEINGGYVEHKDGIRKATPEEIEEAKRKQEIKMPFGNKELTLINDNGHYYFTDGNKKLTEHELIEADYGILNAEIRLDQMFGEGSDIVSFKIGGTTGTVQELKDMIEKIKIVKRKNY